MDLNLKGKTVVITGGATGMGFETASLFGAEGCSLAICGRRQAVLDEAGRKLEEQGYPVLCQRADVTDPVQVEAFADAVMDRFGKIDVWINNAGMPVHKGMMEIGRASCRERV